jgi:hypothetical protein
LILLCNLNFEGFSNVDKAIYSSLAKIYVEVDKDNIKAEKFLQENNFYDTISGFFFFFYIILKFYSWEIL